MKKSKLFLVFLLTLFLFFMLSCTMFIGGPDYPSRSIPASSESVYQLQTAIAQAWEEGSVSDQLTFTITEQQLTSYFDNKIKQQTEPLITDPQVFLQDNQIEVYGTAKQGYFQATVAITMTAGVDEQGELAIEITSVDFGPLPVPSGLLEAITAIVKEAYTGAVGPIATGIRILSIEISDGTMTITGLIK